ncbi:MAG: 30S ribosomal protein S2 [Desulfobacterales bacterium CG2_30_60_27]|nr:MAG: 30S ribosomal protein S2 [Desulfobacterales bacterium CG2_30_60_27]
MSYITMKEMLAAGLHFGHQTHRWNPKMKPFIYGARNKIYIIDLDKTLPLFNKAYDFVAADVAKGGSIMFVGTKRQAQEIIKEEAERCGMFYVNHRWLGGMLTNFQTIKKRVERLKQIEAMVEDGTINQYKKKEALKMTKEMGKLKQNLDGIKNMRLLPSLMFVVDPKREDIAVDEANRLGIPVVAIADTNCDPDGLTYLIPGNDDALRAIKLITSRMADAAMIGMEKRKDAERAAADKQETKQEAKETSAAKPEPAAAETVEAGDATGA